MSRLLSEEKLRQVKQLVADTTLTYREIGLAVGLNHQTVSILSVAWGLRRKRGRRKKQELPGN